MFFERLKCFFRLRKKIFVLSYFKYAATFWTFYSIFDKLLSIWLNPDDPTPILFFIILVFLAPLFFSFYEAFPTIEMRIELDDVGTTVNVRFGDLFKCKGVVAIGVNDYFDTEVKNGIISPTSLHGMFVKNIVGTEIGKFEAFLHNELSSINGFENDSRRSGKKIKYPVGTTVAYSQEKNDYLLTAISEMNEKNEAHSNMALITLATFEMLRKARSCCNGKPLFMPLWGTGLSRTNMRPKHVLMTLLTAIYYEAKQSKITNNITIVIYEKMLTKFDLKYIVEEWGKNGVS